MATHAYRITTHVEEGHCEECGMPLYVGDWVVYNDADTLYCSRDCCALDNGDDE
jgi:hypothetical protein